MIGRRTMQVSFMLGGLIAWAIQFTLIYGITSTVCGRGWADGTLFGFGIVQATILLTTLAALVTTAILFLLSVRQYSQMKEEHASPTDSFISHATFLINGLSLVVIVWHGLPALILPACA
jgi:uncharacterized membrane protein